MKTSDPNECTVVLDDLIERFFDPRTSTLERFLIVGTAVANFFIGLVNGNPISFAPWRQFVLRLLSGVVRSSTFADKHYRGLGVAGVVSASTVDLFDQSLLTRLVTQAGPQTTLYAVTRAGPPAERKRKVLVAKWSIPLAGDLGYSIGRVLHKLSGQ